MKVLYLITTADHGGAQVNLFDLASGWPSDIESIIATGDRGFLTESAEAVGIETVILPNLVRPLHPIADVRAYGEIRALIEQRKPDIVHCHSSKAGLLGRLAAQREHVPVVFTVHGWAFEDGISPFRRAVGLVAEHAARRACKNQHIITVADADRELALRKKVMNPASMTTIHNGIADSDLRADPAQSGEARIVMVARFSTQKDHQTLFKALAGVAEPFKLTLVGHGPGFEGAQAAARDAGLPSQVEFLGNRRDVPDILAESQIFVLSTNWEGFPISILEAMRAGLPVVASDVGGVAEAVIHDETGILTPARDTGMLSDALQMLLSDPELRGKFGSAGRRRFEDHFGKTQMLTKTRAVYENLIAFSKR